MKAQVCKVSESGKSMLVGIKAGKYSSGLSFGWVANPDKLAKGDIIEDFPKPSGVEQLTNNDGEKLVHQDGSPVVKFVFAA